ncbi:ABC transporter ATPase [Dyella japonica]|uniref:ABC transporter ATPase n=1 Tax=Dyella japonica A8 TaxID=1217721 RepID=A0A075K1Z5_9GAMM|nr:ABC transporter ATPase [Dyella japonica]AIF46263.1 ABC transporter ATPase [Dyella japonica A8]
MRRTVLVIALLALTAGLHAQNGSHYRYRWKDASGLPHYSDSLSSEAIKYGYDLVNDRGLVIQHVDRQLTPEERAAAQKAAEAKAATDRQAQQRTRDDQQMLNAYPDEATYKKGQQENLDNLEQQIATTRINLRTQEKALTDLLTRAGDLERAKQTVPKSLNDSIAKQRDVVAHQRDTLERLQTAHDALVQKNTQDLDHYRQLKAAQGKPPQGQ